MMNNPESLSFDRYASRASERGGGDLHAHRLRGNDAGEWYNVIRSRGMDRLAFKAQQIAHVTELTFIDEVKVSVNPQGIRWMYADSRDYGLIAWCDDPSCLD